MKTCLVFPPQIIPTSPPLGISLLKSYVEKNTEQKVKNIDLNLFFHNNVIQNFIDGKFPIYSEDKKNNKSIELIKKSLEIFKKQEKSIVTKKSKSQKSLSDFIRKSDFFNPDVYNPCANEFLYLFDKIFNANRPLLESFVNNQAEIGNALAPFTKEIIKESPELIGFSILTTEQIYYTLALAKKTKTRDKCKDNHRGGVCKAISRKVSKI